MFSVQTPLTLKFDVDQAVDLVEGDLLNAVRSMWARGMTIAAIASALSLPLSTIQATLEREPVVITQRSTLSDLDILARTIYAEARGESSEGRYAVASVIYNRARGDPEKMVAVVTKPYQFSPWNKGNAPPSGKGLAWGESIKLARALLDGSFAPTISHTHFYNPKLADPSWAYSKRDNKPLPFVDIGRHRFLTVESSC